MTYESCVAYDALQESKWRLLVGGPILSVDLRNWKVGAAPLSYHVFVYRLGF